MTTEDVQANEFVGIDSDWEMLLYLGVLREGECREGVTYITDGNKWGAMYDRRPIIPVMYDIVQEDEYQYGSFHIVCCTNPYNDNRRFDIYKCSGGLKLQNQRQYHYVIPPLLKMEYPPVSSDKFFICLANSYKRGGRCVAGIEIVFDANGELKPVCNGDGRPRWIRPIATTTYGEIPNYVAEGIKLLSIVKLYNVVPCPNKPHTENVYYSKLEQCKYDLSHDISIINHLFDNTHQVLFHNRGRAVSAEMSMGINYSLMLIHAENACAYIDENREKSKNRMSFTYYGADYDFPITDPIFLEEFKKEPERFANIADVYLTISLGLEFEGWHHKLVAGVIIPTVSSQNKNVVDVSYMEQQKRLHANAYAKWTPEDDEQLKVLYRNGTSIQELTKLFGRNEGAIYSRISKLGLEDERGIPQQTEKNWFDKYDQELARLLDKRNEIDEQINEVRAKILKQMESQGLDKINSEQFSVSYTPAKTVMQFDTRAFREENESLYLNYCKSKQREASIVVKRNINN